jgi:hypothetical protein
MANGFCRSGATCREIDEERRVMRHSSNSFDASVQILAIMPRLFRNTKQCVRQPTAHDIVG